MLLIKYVTYLSIITINVFSVGKVDYPFQHLEKHFSIQLFLLFRDGTVYKYLLASYMIFKNKMGMRCDLLQKLIPIKFG